MTTDPVLMKAVELLREARKLNNQTVRSAGRVDKWHRETDRFLAILDPNDDRTERLDDPQRQERRDFVDRISRDW